MPAIAKTSESDVIDAARSIIADCGIDGITLHALADSVGIKAPSLYKRFAGREEIIRRVQLTEFTDLARNIAAETLDLPPQDAVRTIARIYWNLSLERPRIYEALFSGASITEPEDLAVRTSAMLPIFDACRALAGAGVALGAARTVTAYIHGFITMNMAGVFQQSPGIEGSYYFGLNAIIKGIASPAE